MDLKLAQEVQTRYILHWNYRNLSVLPEELLQYGAHIEDLYFKENGLIEVPENLHEKLKNLAQLYLYGNRLEKLPESIGKLQTLQILDLCRNRLATLPKSMGDLINLTTLDVSHNSLMELPDSIGNLEKLQVLIAVKNSLIKLPTSLKNLTSLKSLHLNGNQLSALPKDLCQCLNLTDLYLEGNRLTSFPEELTMLPNLAHVNLMSNDLQELPSMPFLSNSAKVLFDENPGINEIPFIFGCQQNNIKSPKFRHYVHENDSHLWSNMRAGGCFQVASRAHVKLAILQKNPPSLMEQSCRALYRLCYCKQLEENFKRVPRTSTSYGKRLLAQGHDAILPRMLKRKLKQGPRTFCCCCLQPIFSECFSSKALAPISVNGGQIEPVTVLYFCTELCCKSMKI